MSLPRLLLLLSALATLPARAEAGFELTEPPAWVEPTAVDTGRLLRAEDAVSGLHVLLSEEQVRVSPEKTERFVRRVRRVASSRGVEAGSELRVTFSNSHERLRLHGIWRTRDGVRTQLLRAEEVKLLQRERLLDMGIYSDERTAVVFLQDVRVGDLLEEAHTVEETHPLFRGHHLDALQLGEEVPVAHLRPPAARPDGPGTPLPGPRPGGPAHGARGGRPAGVPVGAQGRARHHPGGRPPPGRGGLATRPGEQLPELGRGGRVGARARGGAAHLPRGGGPGRELALAAHRGGALPRRGALRPGRGALPGHGDRPQHPPAPPTGAGARPALRRLQGQGAAARHPAAHAGHSRARGPGALAAAGRRGRHAPLGRRLQPRHRSRPGGRTHRVGGCHADPPARPARRSHAAALRQGARGRPRHHRPGAPPPAAPRGTGAGDALRALRGRHGPRDAHHHLPLHPLEGGWPALLARLPPGGLPPHPRPRALGGPLQRPVQRGRGAAEGGGSGLAHGDGRAASARWVRLSGGVPEPRGPGGAGRAGPARRGGAADGPAPRPRLARAPGVGVSSSDAPGLSRTTSLALSAVFLLVLGSLGLGLPQRLRRFVRERRTRQRAAPRPVRHLREREEGVEPILVESLDQADQHILRERCSCGGTYERVPDAFQLRRTGSDGQSLTVLRVRCASCGAPQLLSFHVRPN